MIVYGIDYSMTSPAICIHVGEEFKFENCIFFYKTKSEKFLSQNQRFRGSLIQEHKNQEIRFNMLGNWAISVIQLFPNSNRHLFLEGYSYASRGQVFSIGENTGVLKNKIYHIDMDINLVTPGVMKKFAVGKGNANKKIIIDNFEKETGLDIHTLIGTNPNNKITSPTDDICDSYYLCKYGFSTLKGID